MQFHREQRHWAGAVVAGRLAHGLLCAGHWSSLLQRTCHHSAPLSSSLRAVIVVMPCPSSSPRHATPSHHAPCVRTIVVIAPSGVCTTPSSSPLQCAVVVVISSLSRAIDIVRLCTMPGPYSLVDDGHGGAGGALRSLSRSCTIEVTGWHVSVGSGNRHHAFVHDARAFGPDGGWYRGVLLVLWHTSCSGW